MFVDFGDLPFHRTSSLNIHFVEFLSYCKKSGLQNCMRISEYFLDKILNLFYSVKRTILGKSVSIDLSTEERQRHMSYSIFKCNVNQHFLSIRKFINSNKLLFDIVADGVGLRTRSITASPFNKFRTFLTSVFGFCKLIK